MPPPPDDTIPPAEWLDSWVLQVPGLERPTLIGRGGFGSVYRAFQPVFGRMVAVKILDQGVPTDRLQRAFDRERRAMGAVSGHPNIVTVYDSGTSSGRPYLIMEYLPTGSLAEVLGREGRVPWPKAVEIGVKLAGALEVAHREGILHGDVKPENVLLSGFGEPQLGDFGIARLLGTSETRSEQLGLSILHAAPEVLLGERASPASDVYSLGSTLFHLVAGAPPFPIAKDESLVARIVRVRDHAIPDLGALGLPGPVAACLERALAKRPPDRPATAAEFGRSLQDAQVLLNLPRTPLPLGLSHEFEPATSGNLEVSSPSPSTARLAPAPEVPSSPERRRLRIALVGLAVLVAVAAAIWAVLRPPSAPARDPSRNRTGAETMAEHPSESVTSPATSRPLPDTGGQLTPGLYTTPRFRPRASFELADGWRVFREDADVLELTRVERPRNSFVIARVEEVFAPDAEPTSFRQSRTRSADMVRAAPSDLTVWLQGHPRLETEGSTAAAVGRTQGRQLDLRARAGYAYANCRLPCVLLFRLAEVNHFVTQGDTNRFWIVRHGDETLTVSVSAPDQEFEPVIGMAAPIVLTLVFGD